MSWATLSPAISATRARPKSMPDVTPPAVITLPSLTMRAFSCVAPTRGRSSAYPQCVAARRPLSRPAAPRMNAPVHTDVTYRAVLACRRTKSMVSSSPSASITPLYPPGTQIKSRSGQFSKVCVGMRLRPLSLGTGSLLLATMCIAESGSRASTCWGPVKSSCVKSGKMTKPTLKSDMETSTDAGACCTILSFDHLIRSREERGRDREAEGLCGPEVYNQLNLGCLLYRQVSRFAALQNLANVVPYLPVCVVEPGAITNQAPCGNELAEEEHGRDCITCSQGYNLFAPQDE